MSYDAEKLSLQSGYPGKQMFTYHTSDAIATVVASGYFDQAVLDYNLSTGDLIFAVTETPTVDILVVDVTGSTATVTNGT